ncbi:MAG: hypothetical protein H6661_08640 [Ardenticatenaceae bacterium]|nr:hypothetical protein [Ardenticatenaceae bacterium]
MPKAEIAARPDGQSVVENGRFAEPTLSNSTSSSGWTSSAATNEWAQQRQKFPLLIKLLDNDALSVQVHQ